jgi:hypothetical protein
MKCLIYSLIVFFSTGIVQLPVRAINYNEFGYKITGEINGLLKGDTLYFEKIILPQWSLEPAFQVIVEEDDRFSYEGLAYHSPYLLMTYKSVSGKVPAEDRRGLIFLVSEGELLIKGNAETIYYCQLEGGVYDNAYIQDFNRLENRLGSERGLYGKLAEEARLAGDTLKQKEYIQLFNSYVPDHRDDYDKLSQLRKEFVEKVPSSDLNIIDMLQRVTYTPLDELNAYYKRMDKSAQKSYYGILLRQEIDNMEMLAPGNEAPDFILQAMDGQQLSLDDYSGYYVLIYHFGLCPGSLMIDREISDFQLKYKDKVKVIGVTEEMSFIKEWAEKADPSEKLMNIELKPALESMASHPWPDVENRGDNRQISIDYAFAGLPFFVLISPEKKILLRGFHETFYEARKLMEDKTER